MTPLALVRHAPTQWNAERRLQGRRDIPLSKTGRATAAGWRLPTNIVHWQVVASPLSRALETASMLRGAPPPTDPRLAEMAWGDWEGRTLADLRTEDAARLDALERQGLHFKAPKGESPMEVRARLAPLFAEIAAKGAPTVAVCHKGVIRAALAWATGWDMQTKPPHKIEDGCLHLFALEAAGAPRVLAMNRPLDGTPLDLETAETAS